MVEKNEEKKTVEELTVKECLAELKKLAKDVEFDTKWNAETPLAELQALVAEGRKALAEESEDEPEEGDEDEDEEDEGAGESVSKEAQSENKPEPTPVRRSVRDEITVVLKDGTGRTYSKATHGQHWETLAKAYAKYKGGTIA